jgi:hypothetical protein
MGSNVGRSITGVLLITFVLWYLLRQTGLGRAYTSDMLAIPRSFAAGEGLNSAGRYQ